MAATIGAIYRYPVKGLSAEQMDCVALTPGECLPHDRRFAIALCSTLSSIRRIRDGCGNRIRHADA